jgi:hypothetical protein
LKRGGFFWGNLVYSLNLFNFVLLIIDFILKGILPMKKVTLFFALLFVTITLQAQVQPTDTDGDGIINISTLDHLRWVSENDSCWSWNFELDNDIDASDTKNWNEGLGWSPIGNGHKAFTGIFDGNGYAINGLYVSRGSQEYIGLFGAILGVTSELKNLGVTDSSLNGKNGVGGIVGSADEGSVSNCYFTGSIVGTLAVGGLVGAAYNSPVINSYTTGRVEGLENTGGLVGINHYGTVSNSYSSSYIFSWSNAIGGLIGYNAYGTVINSYATGTVDSSTELGGLIGHNHSGTVINSYSTGLVRGSGIVGGLVGVSDSSTTTNCFWDTETSGLDSSDGGTPKTTAQMKTISTFTNAGWDFETIWGIEPSTNDGYPILTDVTVSVTENILPTTNLTCSPNPCNTSSKIGYSVNNAGFVNIAVYDMLGNEVAMLVNNYQAAGAYEIVFNAEEFSAGIYFITINTAETMETKKIIVAR